MVPGFFFAWLSNNWEVYLNGELVQSRVNMDADGGITRNNTRRGSYFPVDKSLLQLGENYLAVHIIGDPSDANTGLFYLSPYYMDDYSLIHTQHTEALILVFIGIYFFVGIYYLLLFLQQPDIKYNFYYGISSIFFGIYSLMRCHLVYMLIPDGLLVVQIEVFFLILSLSCMIFFMQTLNGKKVGAFAKVHAAVCFLLAASLFFGTLQFCDNILLVWYIIILPYAGFVIVSEIIIPFIKDGRHLRKTTSDSLGKIYLNLLTRSSTGNILVGISIAFICAAYDILSNVFFETVFALTRYGMFILTTGMAFGLSGKFGELYNQVRAAKVDLEKVNAGQEDLIKQRTAELERETERAQAANAAKSVFLANMSHEIRTPMNAIMGMSDLMRVDNLDVQQKSYFADIKKMSKSLLQLINDILDFSKIEAGKMELLPIHFDFYALYINICSVMRFLADQKGLVFVSAKDADVPRYIYADETRVRQILSNVLNNAVKYTHRGSVSVNVSMDGANILVVKVDDTGVGIEPEELPLLFDSFHQVDPRRNRGITGTGLGLAITKQLLDMMGGSIEAASVYEQGSSFVIKMPFAEGDQKKAVVQGSEIDMVQAREGVMLRALAVDDTDENLAVIKGFLSRHKIDCDCASGGKQALDMVREALLADCLYDIVFMDHMMPEMDGLQTTAALRDMPGPDGTKPYAVLQKLPVIALTANAVLGARELFLQSGMQDFISKPINRVDLNTVLFKWLPPWSVEVVRDVKQESADVSGLAVPGLDAQKALVNMGGSAESLRKALTLFCDGLELGVSVIRDSLKAGDLKNYAIKTHAYKGVMALFGNDGLSAKAAALEAAAKDGVIEFCQVETGAFVKDLTEFRANVASSQFMDGAVVVKKAGGKALLVDKLISLAEACRSGGAAAVNAFSGELAALTFDKAVDDVIKEIVALAGSFDYEEAADKAEELLAGLEIQEDD
jgi:signal transduction histidine kinase/CheY-like chemotaxis protein